ncbi:hypothetical protein EJ08DRAFT_725129 [Tothia fuscella]|uniref:Uncharacterized protein n=1 Tax=Tothia fuscella TaxID=1048955 RepID=A0A9P4TUJ2_9PEZI|nr:hypothetical protein EJ08DRAFT_725129 [Tothia fuscella]
MSTELTAQTKRISDSTKNEVAVQLWGYAQTSGNESQAASDANRRTKLDAFFDYFVTELGKEHWTAALDSETSLSYFVAYLKQAPGKPKKELKDELCTQINSQRTTADNQAPAASNNRPLSARTGTSEIPGQNAGVITNAPVSPSKTPSNVLMNPGVVSAVLVDRKLCLAARLMLSINLEREKNTNTNQQQQSLCPIWKDDMSIVELVQRQIPQYSTEYTEGFSAIKTRKLRARYLENHAGLKIIYTRRFQDHLKLVIGENKKTLHVFELAGFLDVSYEALSDLPVDTNLEDSLKRGCYNPALLRETIMTIQILFPLSDKQWIEKRLDKKSVDKRLAGPFNLRFDPNFDNRPLTNTRELYLRFPHWAVRLHMIYEEAEDPTPMNWMGRWAERRKASRHVFWLTFVAFLVAITFGITATVLGCLQVWISWKSMSNSTASTTEIMESH